jgi:hypothetical protein
MILGTPKIYLETTMFNFPFVPDKPGYTELKAQTFERVSRVNAREGYKRIGIFKPVEVLKNYENI